MKTKHTKGEWTPIILDLADYKQCCVGSESSGKVIAHILIFGDTILEEDKANTKLIAAAPEMLKALQCISSFVYDKSVKGCTYGDTNYDSESAVYGYNMCLDNLQEIANNAIKKATE